MPSKQNLILSLVILICFGFLVAVGIMITKKKDETEKNPADVPKTERSMESWTERKKKLEQQHQEIKTQMQQMGIAESASSAPASLEETKAKLDTQVQELQKTQPQLYQTETTSEPPSLEKTYQELQAQQDKIDQMKKTVPSTVNQ